METYPPIFRQEIMHYKAPTIYIVRLFEGLYALF